ncbi:hypothetical protein SDRG_13138 [Saprolegnia diclina VS20]|uniref:Fe2OG dioxygenase domain-containing protein n=1 Tax=Saprolegnia diclina (strain VS20) TaxID=1156394 RepID=T0RH25_SAPDV|nr:hypothetical protein SDRG_13138 [Saprolegnia diclina VS20]EQC29107.1 hypothetical protein SDRG_13138 [Saprolegnia diclina VS20]|eukprot:XP_008617442.1 hypothetical protein SDRG_13138 [Saprolegnia diclina VS20]
MAPKAAKRKQASSKLAPVAAPAAPAPAGAFAYEFEKKVGYASSFLEADRAAYLAPPTFTSLYDGSIQSLTNLLTKAECQDAIAFSKKLGYVRVTQAANSEYAFRDNDRLLFQSTDLAGQLWARLAPLLADSSFDMTNAVGCNPAMRFYRYKTGQAFGCHVDESILHPVTGYRSAYTLLIYLNDEKDSDLVGGHTLFYTSTTSQTKKKRKGKPTDGPTPVLDVGPDTGKALLHGHGEHCLEHEGQRVERGEKYVLRSDIMFQRS